jgi:hypothetical protein
MGGLNLDRIASILQSRLQLETLGSCQRGKKTKLI